jgi:fimbrial isopeptide formation D2 family protein
MRITADGGGPYRNDLKIITISLVIFSVANMLLVGSVSAMARNPYITKDSDVCDCVNSGGDITYTICYDNPWNCNIYDVVITDTLPEETNFSSASDNGTYNSGTHTVTWNIGTVNAITKACVTVTVTVKSGTSSGSRINNSATLNYTYNNKHTKTTFNETEICETQIPEFATIALPVASILGMFFFFNRRKRNNQSPTG